jgi:hypothetical protein
MAHKKILAYAATAPIVGIVMLGATVASAHGMGFGGGFGPAMTPDQAVEKQQASFQQEADLLGISLDEVKNAWAQGKSMSQLAQERNITSDQLRQKMQDKRLQDMKTRMQTLVDNGVVTRAQADQRLQFMQSMSAKNAGRTGSHKGFFGFGR